MSEEKLVIFDLDNTILNGDSDYSMINFLVAKSILDNSALDVNQSFMDDYKKGKLDFDEYTKFALQSFIGMSHIEISELTNEFVKEVIEPMINIYALKIIHDHQDYGCKILIASSTNELIVKPIAKRLEVVDCLGTKVEFIDNKCTGKHLPPSALGEGKLKLVSEWSKIKGFNLELATFYSDSINDLPLLEKVNNPIAVNPDPKLEKISIKRGWEILDLPRI